MSNEKCVWPILLYPKQAQDYLGVGPTKFYEWVKLPNFPKPRNPQDKRPMYLRSEIDAWAKNIPQGASQ